MRVLHLLTTLDHGGAEHQVAALCRRLAARGRVRPFVAYMKGDGELAPALLAAGVPVARVGQATPWEALRLLREVRPDALHTHLFKADLLGAALARRAGVPALLSTKHNEDPHLLRAPWRGLGRRAARRARRVVAISEAVARFVREALDLAPAEVRVLRYGIEPPPPPRGGARFRASLGVEPAAPLAVAIARLSRQKGLDILVEAAAILRGRNPAARIALVGRGEEEAALRDLVRSRGLDGTVLFAGFLADTGPALDAADAVVLPSRWEGFGLAALEAMAAGRPVVASSAGGLPEVLGGTGALVPPGDAKALAAALEAALAPEAVAAVRSGAAGEALRRRVREEFPLERAAAEHEALYAEAVGGNGARAAAPPRAARLLLVARAGTGGAARHVRMLVERLDRARFEPTVAVSPLEDPAFPAALASLGARVVEVPMRRDPAPLRDLAAFHAVRSLVRSGDYDLVHAHTSKPGAFARLAAARSGPPVVYTPHGWYFEYAGTAAARALFLRAERRLGARGGLLHCVSEAEADAAVREGIAARDRIRVVPNGVPAPPPADPARLDALRRELGLAPGVPVALMAARLAPPKDPLAFLAAARAVPGARLLLAGSGALLEECRAAAGPGATVLGERADVADLIALCDVAVLATRYDACPYFALEAAAAGRALVAPPAALPRALDAACIPFDPADRDSLARALGESLSPAAADRRRALGDAARRAWESSFTPERWMEGMAALYGELL